MSPYDVAVPERTTYSRRRDIYKPIGECEVLLYVLLFFTDIPYRR